MKLLHYALAKTRVEKTESKLLKIFSKIKKLIMMVYKY